MKQLTHNLLKMNFKGISLIDISRIEFAFSQNIGDPPLKTAVFPSETVIHITENVVGVVFTKEETALFQPNRPFYADTRITLKNSEYQPETPVVKLKMNPTLFERE
jgi:hypothetical protein